MGPAGYVAMLAGWITTEVGRQPWWYMALCEPKMVYRILFRQIRWV